MVAGAPLTMGSSPGAERPAAPGTAPASCFPDAPRMPTTRSVARDTTMSFFIPFLLAFARCIGPRRWRVSSFYRAEHYPLHEVSLDERIDAQHRHAGHDDER